MEAIKASIVLKSGAIVTSVLVTEKTRYRHYYEPDRVHIYREHMEEYRIKHLDDKIYFSSIMLEAWYDKQGFDWNNNP